MARKQLIEILHGFCAIEGPDGCGKTSALNCIRDMDRALPERFLLTKEPTRKPPDGVGVDWFLADRVEHLRDIRATIKATSTWVLSDRYHLSSMVYQRCDWPDFIPLPEITFVILPELEVLEARAHGRVLTAEAEGYPLDPNDVPARCAGLLDDYERCLSWMRRQHGARFRVEEIRPTRKTTPQEVAELIMATLKSRVQMFI